MTQEILEVVSTIAILVGVWKLDSINKTLGSLTKGLEIVENEVGRLRERMHEMSNWIYSNSIKRQVRKKKPNGTEQRSKNERPPRRKAS